MIWFRFFFVQLIMCSKIGFSPNGNIGFGRNVVYGWSLVPNPPARITAFTNPISCVSIYVRGWIVTKLNQIIFEIFSKTFFGVLPKTMIIGSFPKSPLW